MRSWLCAALVAPFLRWWIWLWKCAFFYSCSGGQALTVAAHSRVRITEIGISFNLVLRVSSVPAINSTFPPACSRCHGRDANRASRPFSTSMELPMRSFDALMPEPNRCPRDGTFLSSFPSHWYRCSYPRHTFVASSCRPQQGTSASPLALRRLAWLPMPCVSQHLLATRGRSPPLPVPPRTATGLSDQRRSR